ncbi:putative Chitin synthase 1 (putative) [Rhodotorula toruloides]|uniref:Chitin synthase n=1 Tax=Rhodotorula toruloides TaxID=5286 RepID=A0A2T0AH87_RHOTO|nr:putative Chitin synthase 1 (putative) [Rhodotorula toruloides]PRQ77373.1 Chitin synthase-domain containing protein [Rhodotorula toruloides]
MHRRPNEMYQPPSSPFQSRPDAPPTPQRPQGRGYVGGGQGGVQMQPQPSYHSHRSQDPYDETANLYGFYAAEDNASTTSHTALNMPVTEKDYYHSPPPPASQHLLSPHYSPSHQIPAYPPPPSPSAHYVPMPSPHGYFPPQPLFSPSFQPGAYYESSSHYAQARQAVMKRREQKKVELVDGHLVLELNVPRSLKQVSRFAGEDMREESGWLRYTAVTDDPDDFTRKRYRLRQVLAGRQTELFICCTMYNEDEELFCRTFRSVIKNIQHLQSRTKSKTWGVESWKKVVVCIVSDGRAKINPRTLKILGLQGVYQDGVMKDSVEGRDTQAHVFEYTTQVMVDSDGTVKAGISPIQVIFCLKEQNQKKLNSHRWAFNAFAPQLRPNVCVLIDVGTKPASDSIYKLWKAFDKHPHVGGACGEITVDLGKGWRNLVNPLVAAQNFEYKMSHILDKSLESVFGFISVLPGAFSAYRYKALLGEPLQAYFAGEKMHQPGNIASLSDSNMYLAEDRILCFEIVTKKREAWVLRFVKGAQASTDVPDSVAEFISQRRRWMNGAFFAALYATTHYYRVWTSGQNVFRCMWLSIIFLYNAITLVFSFLGLSSFYLAFYFLCTSATSDSSKDPFGGYGSDVIDVANWIYMSTIGVCIVCALGNKPSGSRWWYILVMFVFAALFGIAIYCTGWVVYNSVPHTVAGWKDIKDLLATSAFRNLVISIGATLGLYIISSVLHLDPWHVVTCFVQYMMFLPSFMIVLQIYAFANLHDLAWGTKGDTTVKDLGGTKKTKTADGKEVLEVAVPTKDEDIDELWQHMKQDIATPQTKTKSKRSADQKQADHFANIRTNTLLFYLGANLCLAIVFSSTKLWTKLLHVDGSVSYYSIAIFWAVAGLSAFRFVGSTMYLVMRMFGH